MTITMPPDTGAGAFRDPDAPSLATLLEALTTADLPPRQVADLRSAVRSLCRVLGQPPSEVPADPGVLGRALRHALPAAAGIAPPRWANIKSLVLKALAVTGCKVLPGRSLHPLTPAWAALDALLPDKYFRAALSRLMHYCSAQGIEPGDVDQAVFDRFGTAIMSDSFIRNQRVAHQTAARLWNRAVATLSGWPRATIVQPRYAKPYALRLESFPPRSRPTPRAGWAVLPATAPCSTTVRCGRCGRARSSSAASTCARPPRPWSRAAAIPPPSLGLADLVTVEAMQAILRFFLARSGNQPTSQIHGLATHLKAIARHHVGVPPLVLEQLGRMVRRVAPPQTGMAAQEPAGPQAARGSGAARTAGAAAARDLCHPAGA